MEITLFIIIFVSFFLTLTFLPKWIKKCNQVGILWEDMNKKGHPKNVASSGGIIVVMAFVLSLLLYIAIKTFLMQDLDGITIKLFSILTVILILAIVGLTDDFLGWKNGGLSAKFRIFLVLFASIPLIVINSGDPVISLPLLGSTNLGVLYILFFIPIGILGATTTYNFLAGYNGLEASQGIIILSFLSFVTYQTGSAWLTVVSLCMVASLIAFYIFNKFPAKVFPGDILTYSIGGLIAIIAILGNIEKIAIFVFIPYILETILKLRGKLKKYSFAKVSPGGSLEEPYDKIYGLEHMAIRIIKKIKPSKKVYEYEVVWAINLFQILIIAMGMFLFRASIF